MQEISFISKDSSVGASPIPRQAGWAAAQNIMDKAASTMRNLFIVFGKSICYLLLKKKCQAAHFMGMPSAWPIVR